MSLANDLLNKRSAFKPKAYAETPYNAARQEWNDRTGALIKQAYNWRLAFFAQFLISVIWSQVSCRSLHNRVFSRI